MDSKNQLFTNFREIFDKYDKDNIYIYHFTENIEPIHFDFLSFVATEASFEWDESDIQNKLFILYFNSLGGDFYVSSALYYALRQLRSKCITVGINLGQISTAAMLPYFATTFQFALPTSQYYFTDFKANFIDSDVDSTELNKLDNTVKLVTKIRSQYVHMMSKEIESISPHDLHRFLASNVMMSAEEALEHKLIDAIVEDILVL